MPEGPTSTHHHSPTGKRLALLSLSALGVVYGDIGTSPLGRDTILVTGRPGMARWRERLFAVMSRNTRNAASYFPIPPARAVEVGIQVEL